MYEMKLHDIGEGMTEGEIVHFLVQVGDVVTVDQPVLEVQTDKVTAELPCPVAGKIAEILVKKGDVVEVGSTILKIEESVSTEAENPTAEAGSLTAEKETPVKQAAPTTIKTSTQQGSIEDKTTRLTKLRNVMAAPYTRKIAREHGIQIEKVKGTGKNGRITVQDVLNFTQQEPGAQQEVASAQEAFTYQKESAIEESTKLTPVESGKSIPFRGRRKQIAQKMTQSMFTIPHVTHFDKIDMTKLVEIKDQFQQAQLGTNPEQTGNQKMSIMAFLIKALSISLRDFPIFNAKLNEEKEEIYLDSNINIGIATHTEEGLIVPILKNAQTLSIAEINQQMKALTKKAQAGELQGTDVRGGTFTISNVGPIGGMFATPIINHPEVALISFHQMEDQPVVRDKEIVIRTMLNFSMSFDHRVADGVTAVQFTNRMKHLIENPMQLFVHLT
jgi:2-oxoisovalerate dehydrogenase E2 component (dihydrolipoyl transacylase)